MRHVPPQKEVLACGLPVSSRLESLIKELDEPLFVRAANTRDELVDALAGGRQPLCIIPHEVPSIDPLAHVAELLSIDEDEQESEAFRNKMLEKIEFATSQRITAYELLPELVRISPDTKFVITSHTRGFGISPEQRALYKQRHEVVKVIGFINTDGNTKFLLRLLSRVYFGKA